MSLIFARQNFNPSCPSGGTWYACASGSNFVGCCSSEPCSNGCPDGNLVAASFDPNYYGQFPDQQCSTGSRWYTCAKTSPPFMGCCKANACTSGCPIGDVTAGFLSSNPKLAAAFLPSSASQSASTSTSSSSSVSGSASGNPISSATIASTASGSTTSAPTSGASSSVSFTSSAAAASNSATTSAQPVVTSTPSNTPSTGAIAGGAVGAVAAIALLIGLLLFYCRRRTRGSREHMSSQRVGPDISTLSSNAQGVEVVSQKTKQDQYQDSPYPTPTPMYTPYNPSNPSSPKNPSGYPSISELDITSQPPLPKNSPHPSYELPSPDPSASNAIWELSSTNSTRGRRKDMPQSPPGHAAAYQRVPPGPAGGGW